MALADRLRAGSIADSPIGRRELYLWVAVVLLANQFLRIEGAPASGISDAVLTLFTQNSVFHYIGWYALLTLLREGVPAGGARWPDVACALALAAANALYGGAVVWISATLAALYLWATFPGDVRMKGAAVVLLALALNGLWGPLLFRFFSFPLLLADAALVGTALSAFHDGIGWQGTNVVGVTGDHRILVYGPCSSFHNISLGLLCWVSLTKLARPSWAKGDFAVASLVVTTVVVLNTARLYLIALSKENYDYWHGGTGAEIFAWITTAAVLLISLWGALGNGPTRRPA